MQPSTWPNIQLDIQQDIYDGPQTDIPQHQISPRTNIQKLEAGSRRPEAGGWKLEADSRKLEARRRKLEARSWKPEAGSWKPEARYQAEHPASYPGGYLARYPASLFGQISYVFFSALKAQVTKRGNATAERGNENSQRGNGKIPGFRA